MAKIVSQEELRKQANEILKGVDQLIKAGKLDLAQAEIARARDIDPRNAYIFAFVERIAVLREDEQRKRGSDVARQQMEQAAREKLEESRVRMEEERKRKEEETRKKFEDERKLKAAIALKLAAERKRAAAAAVQKPVSLAAPPDDRKKIEEETRRKFEEEFQNTQKENQRKAENQPRVPASPGSGDDPHSMYKRVLLLAWADGAITKEEDAQLRGLRESLKISPEQHARLEAEAKSESYAQAFKLAWTSGLNANERSTVVGELRTKFQIPAADQPKIESKVLAEIGPGHQQQTIVVIDDEDAIRKLVTQILENSGFVVRGFPTSDEAFAALREFKPDLIMSDINLDTSTMGGFSFYEKVRQLGHLLQVPFIFLSGLTDEGMVRYGKGLGADDYLTKPFSNDLLLDTIKGKLKRFKQLSKN